MSEREQNPALLFDLIEGCTILAVSMILFAGAVWGCGLAILVLAWMGER